MIILNSLSKTFGKGAFEIVLLLLCANLLGACSTNPATGASQFTALMSPEQEVRVGAGEHEKVKQQFGLYDDAALLNYVRQVGAKVAANTERSDVTYQFFVLDSPIVNAFALPGGYIYVSRGLLALANSEAELAAVLAHEIGHITGRHSAERYSQSVITSLGAAVISAAVDSSGVSQALGIGSNLYLSSYSRGQESEADTLGLRYLSRGGYDTAAMSSFLQSLQNEKNLQDMESGQASSNFSYFSTHPATADRVSKTRGEAAQYAAGGTVNEGGYLNAIDGLVYGDSADQGFVRGRTFSHAKLGFTFEVPQGFRLMNQPTQVVATSSVGAVVVFDLAGAQGVSDAGAYLSQIWMKGEKIPAPERITINGMGAATASLPGTVNGQPVTIRLVAIEWEQGRFARFQMAIPRSSPASLVEDLKRATYSFKRLSTAEKAILKPYRVKVVTAGDGDTVASLARRQPFEKFQEEYVRVLNALAPGAPLQAGQRYKIIVE